MAWRSRLAAADLAGAVPLVREYIGLHRRRRDPRGVASGLLMLAECQVSCGEARDAAGTCLSVLEVAAVLDDAEIRARALTLLGMAKHADGQLAQALRAFADAIATYEVAGDEGPDTVELLEAWARCLVDDGQEGAAAATREVAAERRRRLDGVA